MHHSQICANASFRNVAVSLSLLLLVSVGCGGSSEISEDTQTETYAEVKVLVEDFANLYAENNQQAEEMLPGLVETLAGYAGNPIGDQGKTMQALYESASQLESNFDDAAVVEQVVQLAGQLPGDTNAIRQQMEENRN